MLCLKWSEVSHTLFTVPHLGSPILWLIGVYSHNNSWFDKSIYRWLLHAAFFKTDSSCHNRMQIADYFPGFLLNVALCIFNHIPWVNTLTSEQPYSAVASFKEKEVVLKCRVVNQLCTFSNAELLSLIQECRACCGPVFCHQCVFSHGHYYLSITWPFIIINHWSVNLGVQILVVCQ